MRETEDGVTVTIEDISWERVFLRVTYRAERPAQLAVPCEDASVRGFSGNPGGRLRTAVVNITQAADESLWLMASGSSASSCPMRRPAFLGAGECSLTL